MDQLKHLLLIYELTPLSFKLIFDHRLQILYKVKLNSLNLFPT